VLRQIGEKNIRLGIKTWCKEENVPIPMPLQKERKRVTWRENHATLARLGLVSYRKNMYYVGYILYNIPYTDENKRFKRANLKNKRILKARAKSYKIRGLM
jgi:hypothetical protein